VAELFRSVIVSSPLLTAGKRRQEVVSRLRHAR